MTETAERKMKKDDISVWIGITGVFEPSGPSLFSYHPTITIIRICLNERAVIT